MQEDFFDSIGQKRRFDRRPFTSGLPPPTDVVGVRRHVANVPKAVIRLAIIARGIDNREHCEALRVRLRLIQPFASLRPDNKSSRCSGSPYSNPILSHCPPDECLGGLRSHARYHSVNQYERLFKHL